MKLNNEVLFDRSRGRMVALGLGHPPVMSSAALGWRGYFLEQNRLPSLETRDLIWMNHVVSLQLNSITLEHKENGSYVPTRILSGQISIVPWQAQTSNRTRDPLDVICVAIDPTFMSMACHQFGDGGSVELVTRYAVEDRFIASLLLALKREVEEGGRAGQVYSDTLATTLAMHLAVRYSTKRPKGAPPLDATSVVSPRAVRRAIEFIHERLGQDISLKEIADAAGLSPYHFARTFRQHVGLSPHQFVLKQRIERAKQLLLRGDLRPAAIALELGFCDQSHLAQHFRRLTGMTPRQFTNGVRHP